MSDLPPTPPERGQDRQTPSRTPRWIKIVLAVSLAMNLAIAGVVAGAVLGRGERGDVPALRSLGLGPVALALPRDTRAGLRDRLADEAPALREDRAELGRGLRDLRAALMADPFDRARAEAALARSRLAATGLQERGHAALLDALERLPPDARAEVADRLARILRRAGGRERP